MDRFLKFVLAATTTLSVVLSVIAAHQSVRIDRLEREAHPERYAIAKVVKADKATQEKDPRKVPVPAPQVGKIADSKADHPDDELLGETQIKVQAGGWEKGFSRDEETVFAERLRKLGVGKLHNFGVAFGSDGNVLIRGTAPVTELKRVAYEFRPTPGRKGVWSIYRVQWTPSMGIPGTLNQ